MRYCGDCKEQYGLASVIEKEITAEELNGLGCEFCAHATLNKKYFEAWHFIGDIVAREIGKPEIDARTKLELDKLALEKRKLDQKDRELDLLERDLSKAASA